MTRALVFIREPLRSPLTLVLLVAVPALFILSAAGALSDFATALGGSLATDAAIGLSAGWAAAFLSGALGFFQASSSRSADRRLAAAGLGAPRVALSRITASLALALVASAAAFVTLSMRVDIAHPVHAAAAIASFAVLYLCVGIAIGSIVTAPLEGSLLVVFVFLLDVFSGPGMTGASKPRSLTHDAADALIAAGLGQDTTNSDWLRLGAIIVAALLAAIAVFARSARSRA